jgi:hypothetical protein
MKTRLGYGGNKVYEIKNEVQYEKSYSFYERLSRAIGGVVQRGLYEDKPNGPLLEAMQLLTLVMDSMMEYNYRFATSDSIGKDKEYWKRRNKKC